MTWRQLAPRTLGWVAAVGFAGGELLARSGPAVFSVAEEITIPALIVATQTIGLATVGWLFGWAFLGTLVLHRGSALCPSEVRPLVEWFPTRLLMAGTAVTTAIVLEWQLLAAFPAYPEPPVSLPELFVLVPAAAAMLVVAVLVLGGVVRSDLDWSSSLLSVGVRVVVLILCLAVLLVIAAILYPLPELFVIAWVIGAVLVANSTLVASNPTPFNDPIDRLATAGVAAWSSVDSLISFLYLCIGLLVPTLVLLVPEQSVADLRPRELAFFGLTFGVGIGYALWHWLRVAERFPHTLLDDHWTFEAVSEVPTIRGEATTQVDEPPTRPPLLCLPAALPFALGLIYVQGHGTDAVPLGYLVLALVVSLLPVGAVVWTFTDPEALLGEWEAVLGATVVLTFGFLFGFGEATAGTVDAIVTGTGTYELRMVLLDTLAAGYFVLLLVVVPYVSPRLVRMLTDPADPRGVVVTNAKRGLALFAASMVGSVLLFGLTSERMTETLILIPGVLLSIAGLLFVLAPIAALNSVLRSSDGNTRARSADPDHGSRR